MTTVQDMALDFLWGCWRALGVPGAPRLPRDVAVDPEWLIVATPSFAEVDPRLDEMALSWCAQHPHQVSTRRLRVVSRQSPQSMRQAFDGFAQQLEALAGPERRGGRQESSLRAFDIPFHRPSAVALRARAGMGIGVRSDLLLELLRRGGGWARVSELAERVGYTKRSVARTLLDFERAGWVGGMDIGNARTYALQKTNMWSDLLQGRDLVWLPWREWMTLMHTLVLLERLSASPEVIRRAQTVVAWKKLVVHAKPLGLPEPPDPRGRSDAFAATLAWGRNALDAPWQGHDQRGADS